jgi:hypothetical protein
MPLPPLLHHITSSLYQKHRSSEIIMAKTRVRKVKAKNKAKAKDSPKKRGNKGYFQGAPLEMLESFFPKYRDTLGSRQEFWAEFNGEWETAYPRKLTSAEWKEIENIKKKHNIDQWITAGHDHDDDDVTEDEDDHEDPPAISSPPPGPSTSGDHPLSTSPSNNPGDNTATQNDNDDPSPVNSAVNGNQNTTSQNDMTSQNDATSRNDATSQDNALPSHKGVSSQQDLPKKDARTANETEDNEVPPKRAKRRKAIPRTEEENELLARAADDAVSSSPLLLQKSPK